MNENIGKRILWRHKKSRDRFHTAQVDSGTIREVSPSGRYFCIERTDRPIPLETGQIWYETLWFLVDSIEILEVLDK